MKNKFVQISYYLFFDFFAALASWLVVIYFRKKYIESKVLGIQLEIEYNFKTIISFILIALFWIGLHAFFGYYKDVFRKSRLKELGDTFLVSLLGVVFLFFVLFLDDIVGDYKSYYKLFFLYFAAQFVFTYILRLVVTTRTAHAIHRKKLFFNTLLIGNNSKSLDVLNNIEKEKITSGNKFIGFVQLENESESLLDNHLKKLGSIQDIKTILTTNHIEEVIIALESTDHITLQKLISDLDEKEIKIKIIPDMYDIVSGYVRMQSIFGTPLIEVDALVMPIWQQNLKRTFDIVISIFALIILSPLFLILILIIKSDSKGSAFYSQERIGRWGKPFKIFKFRSMRMDAEKSGPALSSNNDNRMTKSGKWLRKFRLDELPQFYNVLIGDMSLVGPRPERQFFIEQIVPLAPHYKLLHRVRPGITSWGQVKYGYAENVSQMIERLKYDILYIENMSLVLDLKIIIYTVLTILKAEGK